MIPYYLSVYDPLLLIDVQINYADVMKFLFLFLSFIFVMTQSYQHM